MGDPLPISFGRGSGQGRFGQLGQARHINAYVEDMGQAGKTPYSAVCINGMGSFAALTGSSGVDCMLELDNLCLASSGRGVFSFNAGGLVTYVGGLPSDGLTTMARNRLTPNPQAAVVRDGLTFIYQAGSWTQLTDADLPPPICVFEVQGYFVFPIADGRFFTAGPNATNVDALDFAEAESSPDYNVMGTARGRTMIFFGDKSTEFWDPNGAPIGVPFGFTTAIDFGCYAAGSVAKMPMVKGGQASDVVVFAATNHEGAYLGVAVLEGYTPIIISTPEVDRAIQAEPDKTSIRSMGLMENERPVYIISGSTFTWAYDAKGPGWHQRISNGRSRWRVACTAQFAGRRLFGHYDAPRILYGSRDLNDEDGEEIVWQIQTPPITMWPKGFKVKKLWIDMVTGVGQTTGAATDVSPELIIDYSRDGVNFGAETRHSLGATAQRQTRVKRSGLGRFDHNGMTVRLTCSSRVSRGLQQLAIDAQPLRG